MGVGMVEPVAATAASTLSDKPRWEKDIEPLVETAAWNPGNNCRANPGTARKCARDFRIRRQAAYSRYRVSIPGRVEAEHRGELAKVNGAGAEALKKLNVSAEMRRFRIIVSRACADEPAGTSPPTTGYGDSRKRRHVAQGAGNTDEDLAVIEAAVASSLVASSLPRAHTAHAEKRVALVIGNNDYKNVPKLQKAL